MPRTEQPRPRRELAAFDRVAQPPRQLDGEILAGGPVREERLEEDWLLHFAQKWPVT